MTKLEQCAKLAKDFKELKEKDALIAVYVGITYPYRAEVQMNKRQYVETFGDSGDIVDDDEDDYKKQVIVDDVAFFALFDKGDDNEKVQKDR